LNAGKKTPPFDAYKESPKAGVWQVRKRNGSVTLVEHRMMAFSQYFPGVEKGRRRPLRCICISRKNGLLFQRLSRHLDDLGPRLTSAALLRKQRNHEERL
jgi:hypothetical protein